MYPPASRQASTLRISASASWSPCSRVTRRSTPIRSARSIRPVSPPTSSKSASRTARRTFRFASCGTSMATRSSRAAARRSCHSRPLCSRTTSVLCIAMASSSSSDRTTPRQPNMAAELEENSQGSQALLELAGASQISLTGLMASQEVDEPLINSQESAAPPLHSDDTASPQRQTHLTQRTCRRADRIGARRRPNGPRRRDCASARSWKTRREDRRPPWPLGYLAPAGAVAAAGVVPMPSATRASTYEEPMGLQEQERARSARLAMQCHRRLTLPERAIDALPRGPSPGQAVPQQAVA